MAEVNPPEFLGAECYTFEDFRQAFNGVVCVEGVTAAGDLAVTPVGGASVDVNVAAGSAWVEGDLNGAEGMYFVENDASKTLTIAANGAGSIRYDAIIATVYDSQYIGASDAWALEVVQGVAGAGAPAIPAGTRSGYLLLDYVGVPASGGTPSTVDGLNQVMVTCGRSEGTPPYVDLASTGATSCLDNALTTLTLASTVHNDEAYFTVASSVVTVVETGFYDVQADALFAGLGSGYFEVKVMKNGLAGVTEAYHLGTGATGYYGATPVALRLALTAGNTIQVAVKQSTGGTANCDGGRLRMWKVG